MYVGLRNGECDVAVSAVESDPNRIVCPASCPDPTVALFPEYPGSDYTDPTLGPAYAARLTADICCLDYGQSYFQSGFALISRSTGGTTSLLSAIVSRDVLNAGTPVVRASPCAPSAARACGPMRVSGVLRR